MRDAEKSRRLDLYKIQRWSVANDKPQLRACEGSGTSTIPGTSHRTSTSAGSSASPSASSISSYKQALIAADRRKPTMVVTPSAIIMETLF